MKPFALFNIAMVITLMLGALTGDVAGNLTGYFGLILLVMALGWFGASVALWVSALRTPAKQ
ncbi:hypothetical protein [Paenibacillus turpanensis]|uniref:hypothetical protein n=1 Tax=Paenibacillus turpanensis TaxID=2689078 RepID=UPI00140AC271|nr:hypothetical protein [Paenibacillus turpanensis]